MSLAAASNGMTGEPDAKKFRFSMPTQVVVKQPLYDLNQNQGSNQPANNSQASTSDSDEKSHEISCSVAEITEQSPFSQPSPQIKNEIPEEQHPINSDEGRNAEDVKSSMPESPANSEEEEEDVEVSHQNSIAALLEHAASIFKNNFEGINIAQPLKSDSMPKLTPKATPPPQQSHQSMIAPIPGSLAVAASPAAQLFDKNDWSWHRNPAASIRSGGTNKQTPVWKYFVYNKVENLSRCIIGDCTYVLKGPHTSTLACHLKKHPAEYAEFQRLKMEYTRDRSVSSVGGATSIQRNGRASSAASNGSNSSHGTSTGCNNRQGSSSQLQVSSSPPTSDAPTMVRPSTNLPSNLLKKPTESTNPLSSIFGANSLLSVNNMTSSNPNMGRQLIGSKNPGSMNDILTSLSARAVAALTQQNPVSNNLTNSSNPAGVASIPVGEQQQLIAPPLHFMNLLKQNGIFGLPSPNFDPKAALQQQSKKWPRTERRQRELETKLALALCSLQVPLHKFNDPFFRDFIETAQPKFHLASSGESVEQILIQLYTRAVSNMKVVLGSVSKVTLMLNASNINKPEDNTNRQIGLCVSVAYHSQQSQRVEVMLLGVRKLNPSEICAEIRPTVGKILAQYDLSMDQVAYTILDGFEEIGVSNDRLDFPNQLRSYRHHILKVIREIVDTSELYQEIKEATIQMIQSFCTFPESLIRLGRLCGNFLISNIHQMPFEMLAQTLLEIRDPFLAMCRQQPADQAVNMISESQWAIMENILRLKRVFNAHIEIVQDNTYVTIDRIVPSIMQLLMTLKKDFPLLGPLPEQLASSIQQKLVYILNPDAEEFDSSFIQATALNPQLAVLLDEHQLQSAKNQIEKTICDRIRTGEESTNKRSGWKANGGVDALLAAVVERKTLASTFTKTPDDNSNASMNTPASSLYPDLVQAANQRRKQIKERNQNGKNHYVEAMVQAYFDDIFNNSSLSLFGSNGSNSNHPLQYWQANSTKCPQLSELATVLLSTPSTAIPPEFILNSTTDSGSNLVLDDYSVKHPFDFVRSTLPTLERDAIIRFNRSFWQKGIPFP